MVREGVIGQIKDYEEGVMKKSTMLQVLVLQIVIPIAGPFLQRWFSSRMNWWYFAASDTKINKLILQINQIMPLRQYRHLIFFSSVLSLSWSDIKIFLQ